MIYVFKVFTGECKLMSPIPSFYALLALCFFLCMQYFLNVPIKIIIIIINNSTLEAQLAAKRFMPINVSGDGNCFFQALSMSMVRSQHMFNSTHRLLSSSPILVTSFSRLLASCLRTQPKSLKLPMRYNNHAHVQAKILHLWLPIFFSETFMSLKRASLFRRLFTYLYVIGYPRNRFDSRSTSWDTIVK